MGMEELYLIGVLLAFGAFGVSLFSVSLWSRRPVAVRDEADRRANGGADG